ncbi:hypothetical protein MYX84_11880 [Acidobacteria bacterium AH-259-O06]|nr:hypothetical protein [Acidobacteria bacterium AH-259-O06]
MISCLLLERPGRWRIFGVAGLLSIAMLPSMPLLWRAATSFDAGTFVIGEAFSSALFNSAVVAFTVMFIALVVGLPIGVLAALYHVPGKKPVLVLVALPLLVPSFLWAIGWSALAARWGRTASEVLSGFAGCIIVFSATGIPLVLLTAFIVTIGLSASQVEAARLAGGERVVFRQALRHAAQPALLAASLAGVLTLSDPGPGLIFGLRSAASDILTSFSALYDFGQAGQQCVILAGVVLLVATPLAYFAAPWLATQVMPRQLLAEIPVRHRGSSFAAIVALLILVAFGILLPVTGISLPVIEADAEFERSLSEVGRTWANTLIYALGAGAMAALLGFLLAFFVGRTTRLRTVCLGICIALFSLPPALPALGLVQLAGEAEAWMDPLLRSRLTVCLALGLRFFPVAAVLGLQAWAATSSSWNWAGAIHGVPLTKYLRKVVLPFVSPTLALAVFLVGLLATADVSTVLLLHPPGQESFPLAIFTVMANAPESLAASLCLLYVAAAGGLLILVARFLNIQESL